MKLLLASVDFFPSVGGVSRFCHQFATALQDAGAQVHLLVPPGSEKPTGERAPYDLIVDDGANTGVREGQDWLKQELPRAMLRLRALQREHQFDRFIALHPYYYGQLFVRLGPEIGVPVSVTAHGFEVNSQLIFRKRVQDFLRRRHGFVSTMREELKYVLKGADEVMVNSNFTAGLVHRAGRDRAVEVIGCGLSEEQIASRLHKAPDTARKDARRELGIPQDSTLVGTVCRLVESKGVDTLLSAIARLPDVHGVVVGDGQLRERLESKARDLGIAERVYWTGQITNAERWLWLEAMDMSVLLSRPSVDGGVEGFGISLLESHAAGTPVIATRTGGIVDVVDDGVSGLLVKANDVDAVVAAISRLRANPDKAMVLVANGRSNIELRFRWDLIARTRQEAWEAARRVSEFA